MAEAITVAFQGEYGAFSEMAARAYFGEAVAVLPCPTFPALFEAVEAGSATHGMIPIENTLMGSIHENYDLLLKHDLRIIGETKLRIVHNLIVNRGVRLEDIRRVYSQPPALAQCTDFIRSLKSAVPEPAADTAGAVRGLRDSGARDAAAIASHQAAIDYDLEILREGIENDHRNYTRFLIVAPDRSAPPSAPEDDAAPAKTSVVFSLKHEAGTLHRSLKAFAAHGINLLKIESRPLVGSPWEYVFYLDFAGHPGDTACRDALRELQEVSVFSKVLGSYRQGNIVEGRVRPKLSHSGLSA